MGGGGRQQRYVTFVQLARILSAIILKNAHDEQMVAKLILPSFGKFIRP